MSTELSWQPSLFGSVADVDADPSSQAFRGIRPSCPPKASFEHAARRDLTAGAWIEEVPAWIPNPESLFEQILGSAPWQAAERPMYDRIVAVPRLHTGEWQNPPQNLVGLSQVLSEHYQVDLLTITANLYRDGSDSVAWHGDRVGRNRADTVVAILTLGSSRRLLLRPNGGGRSVAVDPGPGDLFVMGGTCQRTWEHSVPKRARAGARICVMFRESGGN